MIDRLTDKLPPAKLGWALFLPLAIFFMSMTTILNREEKPHPVAHIDMPREWRLPPGTALMFDPRDRRSSYNE